MNSRLLLPRHLDSDSAFQFASDMEGCRFAHDIELDFGPLEFAQPFGALVLGCELQRFLEGLPEGVRVRPLGIDARRPVQSYLGHVGFFEFVGLSLGKAPGEAHGGLRYVPITEFDREPLAAEAVRQKSALGDIIHKESERIARVVAQQNRYAVFNPIAYCLREIVRNVFEHAEIDHCVIFAQSWNDGSVELAIVDRGCGIRASLSKQHTIDDDLTAVMRAIEPGVSGAQQGGDDDRWANSGFGLFVLSEIGRKFGRFALCSGGGCVLATDGETKVSAGRFHGTAVQLRMKRPKGSNLGELIDQIIREGEARTVVEGQPRRASKSTHIS